MNYEEIVCDANNLYRAYKVSVKSSKWKESTQKFMMNFLRYIFEIQDDLINRTLQNGPTQEFEACMTDTFNKLEYRNIPKEKLTGEKWMEKSVNIGDQLSQVIGIYYPYPIDNYVKYVRQQKFYGRYMDDWYIMNPSKEELEELLENVCKIAAELGIHINRKKTRIVKISSKYKFLQIKYTLTDTGKVIKRINPDRVTAMRRKLKKLAVKVEHEEADYDNVENMFRGWMGGHYKLLSREQRKNLIQLYEYLFSKEITIVNKKLIVFDRSA